MKQPSGWHLRRTMELRARDERWRTHWKLVGEQSRRGEDALLKAINGVFLVNGGTGAALLAFLSNTSDEPYFTVEAAITGIACLGVGSLIAVVGYLCAYWTGTYRGKSLASLRRSDAWPYQAVTAASERYGRLGGRFANFTLCCSIGSAALYLTALAVLVHDMLQVPAQQCGVTT